MSDSEQDVQERLSRLEAQVAQLTERVNARVPPPLPAPVASAGVPPRLPSAPAAARVPLPAPLPARPQNPIVYVAAGGAGIFLIGAIFFLHWSIQQGWLGPEFRFLLGLLLGGALAVGAARLILTDSGKIGVCLLLAGLGSLMFSLRWGALEYHFYPAAWGLAGTAFCVILAGALAGRGKSGAALCVALAAGLVSPLAFSAGGHHEVALSVYLAVLMAAALAVPYLAKVGERWGVARGIALAGTWGLLAMACMDGLRLDAPLLLGLLALHYLLAGLWIWLPGQRRERPAMPTILWFTVTLAATGLVWALWRPLGWPATWFAGPVLLVAALNLLLVKPLRRRMGSRQVDLGLLVLAAGHLALAVPVALDWSWVGPMWGCFALGLAAAVVYAETRSDWDATEIGALLLLALGMAGLASLRWLFHTVDGWEQFPYPTPLLNGNFLEGLLAAGAWALLARRRSGSAIAAFIGLELVGNLTLAMELGRIARHAGGELRICSIIMTLTWALSGAWQWLRSLAMEPGPTRRMLAVAGYVWLGVASCKLLLVDLAEAPTPLRALAFLGVGSIFLSAALVANWARRQRKESE